MLATTMGMASRATSRTGSRMAMMAVMRAAGTLLMTNTTASKILTTRITAIMATHMNDHPQIRIGTDDPAPLLSNG